MIPLPNDRHYVNQVTYQWCKLVKLVSCLERGAGMIPLPNDRHYVDQVTYQWCKLGKLAIDIARQLYHVTE
jgi:hypothetical protein